MLPARTLLVTLCVLTLGACASTPRTAVEDSYFQRLGEVSFDALSSGVTAVLEDEHEFTIERRDEQYATVFYRTAWKPRDPFADEETRGVNEARSRVVVRGQRVADGRFRVLLEGENEIRTDSIPSWHTAPTTESFREWMGEIEGNLSQRLERTR